MKSARTYGDAAKGLDVEKELRALRGPGGELNAALICCGRHAHDEDRVALRYRNLDGEDSIWTFAEFERHSIRLAHFLAALGVGKGDCVAVMLPRTPELIIAALAVWRLGAVYQPLFTAFGPTAVEYRVQRAGTRVVITDKENRAKIKADLDVAVVTANPRPGDHDFWADSAPDIPRSSVADCSLDDAFLLMFTSGTTGAPKPLFVPIRAIAAFKRYMLDGIGLTPNDRFWNLADPGWAYGLYYAVVGPLALGIATTFHNAPFSPAASYEVIRHFGITSLAGSPTAFRLMIGAGAGAAAAARGQLRAVSSAGEPLNPEIARWFAANLEVDVRDHYGQTELGMVLCDHHGLEHPARTALPAPGYHVAVLDERREESDIGEPGMLAIDRSRSPFFWFAGYLGADAFEDEWYFTGDLCERSRDGAISFVGRSDDVITTSGYRVGPFDVESVLLEHEAVLESAVVGRPDAERTEVIKAFVVLGEGYAAGPALVDQLQQHVRSRLSKHAYPREIEFVASLPKTPSGKVQRFLLRDRPRDVP